MTDIKRDFLYEFNRELREVYSKGSSIVSVFEGIDKGIIKLSPSNISDEDFVNEVGKAIFMIKRIVADPYKTFRGKQQRVPVSQAQNVDQESIRMTLSTPAVWSIIDGKRTPKEAYTLIKDYVFINYENAFVSRLITLIIIRLKKIKAKAAREVFDKSSNEYQQFIEKIESYVRKLMRLSSEKVFTDNSRRVVDMSNIFLTDILNTDNRYNYCYKFFCEHLRSRGASASLNKDFRILYHNFALVQLLYCLNKQGYNVPNVEYYISVSGKMFLNTLTVKSGEKAITLSQTNNGVDIFNDNKSIHVEFSKVMLRDDSQILDDYNSRAKRTSDNQNYFVAYLTTSDSIADGAISIGYRNADKTVKDLINSL